MLEGKLCTVPAGSLVSDSPEDRAVCHRIVPGRTRPVAAHVDRTSAPGIGYRVDSGRTRRRPRVAWNAVSRWLRIVW